MAEMIRWDNDRKEYFPVIEVPASQEPVRTFDQMLSTGDHPITPRPQLLPPPFPLGDVEIRHFPYSDFSDFFRNVIERARDLAQERSAQYFLPTVALIVPQTTIDLTNEFDRTFETIFGMAAGRYLPRMVPNPLGISSFLERPDFENRFAGRRPDTIESPKWEDRFSPRENYPEPLPKSKVPSLPNRRELPRDRGYGHETPRSEREDFISFIARSCSTETTILHPEVNLYIPGEEPGRGN